MNYQRIKTEYELIKIVFPQIKEAKTFPCVSRLAQKNIKPDIDILNLSYKNKIEGFETKLLGSDRYGNVNRAGFYKGIGETLLYLRFGVERVGLILGFKDTLKDDDKIRNFIEELKKMKDNLVKILGKHFSLGIYTSNYIDWINKAETDFPHRDYKETEFLKRLIEEERLSYNKKLLKAIKEK